LRERGFNEHLYRREWHIRSVIRVTQRSDTPSHQKLVPHDSERAGAKTASRALLFCYFLPLCSPRYNDGFATMISGGGNKT
jgi:hypothetical protein